MAANSKRERIILQVVSEMESLIPSVLRTVKRQLPAGIEDLDRFASTQLPLACVLGLLPEKESLQGGNRGTSADCSLVKSKLDVQVFGYFMDNVTPDSTLSNLADDFYRVLNADPSKNGLAIGTEVLPDSNVGNWEPYVAFKFVCRVTFIHSLGGL